MAGIYIHIPFCKQACHYCDFHFSTTGQQRKQMVQALVRELELRTEYLSSSTLETVYFGGGTPSLLKAEHLEMILNAIQDHFKLADQPEITLEANPDDLSLQYLKDLWKVGINRLSIGIQSFNDEVLRWMNRAHDQMQALHCVEAAITAGYTNINLDLIFGVPVPGYDLAADLQQMLQLQPVHLSTYQLTIEPRTVFGVRQQQGKLQEVSQEQAAQEFEYIIDVLQAQGYLHYEISNFALPGMESRHNRSYWQQKPYLGIGPSAHSYNGVSRQVNVANNTQYLQAIQRGEIPSELEILSRNEQINERIMTGLRTREGLNLSELLGSFKWDIKTERPEYLQQLLKNNYAEIEQNNLILTRKGKLIADQIAAELFTVE